MDLPTYFRVLWRFRLVVLPGALVAIALAVLSYGKVDYKHGFAITPRRTPVYQVDGLVLVTQQGFPWGSSQQQYIPGNAATGLPPVPVGDLSRMEGIALIYSELASSDVVRAQTRIKPTKKEKVVTSPYAPAAAPPGTVLPMVALSAQAASPDRAAALLDSRIAAFERYLASRQAAGKVKPADRIELQILQRGDPGAALLVTGAKKTLPIVVFLAVMIAVVGAAFMLENMRPRARPHQVPLSRTA